MQDQLYFAGMTCSHSAPRKKIRPLPSDAELVHLLRGILADGEVVPREVEYLAKWLKANEAGGAPDHRTALRFRLNTIIADGIVDTTEFMELIAIIRQHGIPTPPKPGTPEINIPFNAPLPTIKLSDCYCLTGIFRVGKRQHCEEIIIAQGGTCVDTPREQGCHVVVGSQGYKTESNKVIHDKIISAITLRERGAHVTLIPEEHWWGTFGEFCSTD